MISTDTIVGIDIGTTKICIVVARNENNTGLSITGIGRVPSRGLRKGNVVDLERTITSIRESKVQAEQFVSEEIDAAFVSVTGSHIRAIQSSGVIAVTDPNKGITREDTENALDIAQRVEIPRGRRLIDVQVTEYIVDGQLGIPNPVGMSGMRLETNALLITAGVSQLESIYRAVNHAGIDVENIILEPIASGEAVLTAQEKESGVALLDIGGGTTDLAVYRDGGIAHLAIFPAGGDHFDSDLAYGLGITERQAEHIKIKLGGVGKDFIRSDDLVKISRGSSDRKESVPLKIIGEIIYPRLEEILSLVYENLSKCRMLTEIPSGIVLTGGTALLPGIVDMTSRLFGLPVRIGQPIDIGGLSEDLRNPMYATSVGLVKLGAREYEAQRREHTPSGVNTALRSVQDWPKNVLRWIAR